MVLEDGATCWARFPKIDGGSKRTRALAADAARAARQSAEGATIFNGRRIWIPPMPMGRKKVRQGVVRWG